MQEKIDEIMKFWFGAEFDADGMPVDMQACMALWFGFGESQDQEIRARFANDLAAAMRGEYDDWADDVRGRLALIILMDQMSRNIHRNAPEAFACDAHTVPLVLDGLVKGIDMEMSLVERLFFYLPLEHSEDLAHQLLCVKCFQIMEKEVPQHMREMAANYTAYAQKHLDIIAAFGRFPHRNAVLGRTPTVAEEAYLEDGGERFGQGE